MLVWMDEEPMDTNKQFYLKQTTNTTRARIDTIRYKVNVNTMEQSAVDHLELNEIGKVVISRAYMKFLSLKSYLKHLLYANLTATWL